MNNKIKQEIDKIGIPNELHRISELGILKAQNEQQRSRKRNYGKGIIAAAGILISITILSFFNNNSMKDSTAPNPNQYEVDSTEAATDNIRTVEILARYATYSTADELSENADVILVGSPVDEFIDREHRSTTYEDGTLQDFSTLTNLNIESVLKQPTGMNIGSQMEVIEPISIITENGNQQTKITADGYHEMQQGKRYIVFLKDNRRGGFSVINMNNGKFNLDDGDPQDNSTNIKENEFNERLKEDILAKFNLN